MVHSCSCDETSAYQPMTPDFGAGETTEAFASRIDQEIGRTREHLHKLMQRRCSCQQLAPCQPTTPRGDTDNVAIGFASEASGEHERTEEHLRSLFQRRNSLSPVNRLPIELLALVFSMVQAHWREFSNSWMVVTRVCQQWRTVALNSPSLWKCIKFGSPRLAKEMITRAKGLPLFIFFDDRSWPSFDEVRDAIGSIRLLEVCMQYPEQVSALNRMSSDILWDLRSMNLSTSTGEGEDPICLPESETTPELRILTLSGGTFEWDVVPEAPSKLTVFDISFCPVGIPNDVLRNFLRSASQLEIISLPCFLPDDMSDFDERSIHLPHLCLVTLSGTAVSLAEFLSHLEPAPCARLILNGSDLSDRPDIGGTLANCIFSHLPLQKPFLHELAVEISEQSVRFLGWLDAPASGTPRVDLLLEHTSDDWDANAICADMLSFFLLAGVEILRLHVSGVINTGPWEELGASPNLGTIYTSGTAAHDILPLISPPTLSNLSVLDLSHAIMNREEVHSLVSLLLEWRIVGGLQLRELRVCDAYIDIQETLKRL
jgi:hypothetical protein